MPDPAFGPPADGAPPLTPERWRRARTAFDAAVTRAPDARAAVLDAACTGDPALRALVERMLDADVDASLRLGPPLPAHAPATDAHLATPQVPGEAVPPVTGRHVGPYRIVREIGRGGMGTVYLAERDDVGRRVALKLVRGGLASPERVARFLVERRLLARLDHARVARLLDAGVVGDGPDAGTPWFAMEYVDGVPLDRFCAARRLGVPERLRLMERACEAVAYAHRNLVVHRDLKPSNLLVSADGEVTLLDFGIAKLLAADAEDAGASAGLTEAGVRLLTPEYAAPEQVRGESVTTATDVYALGVVLYELLTGTRPFDGSPGGGLGVPLGFAAARPVVRPSVAVVRLPRALEVAAARGTTPERLRRRIAGDLDTIALKALDPNPARRYASAAELLEDLRRHRTGFPVLAQPVTAAYRTRVFVRRNRWGVAAAVGLVALLVGLVVVTTVQQAHTSQALARATAEAAKAREVTRFVTSLLEEADPYGTASRAAGPAAGAVDTPGGTGGTGALARIGAERLDRDLAGQPEVRAELRRTLAVVQRNLGHMDEAESLLRRRLTELRQLRATSAPDAVIGGALHDLGSLRRLRSDYVGSDSLLRQALAIRERVLGARSADLAATRIELAALRRNQGRFAEAEQLLQPAIAVLQPVGGPPLADALDQLVDIRAGQGDRRGAIAVARRAIAMRERLEGPSHPAIGLTYSRLAGILEAQGRSADAERAIRRALAIQRTQLPPEHRETLASESTLAWILLSRGKAREAEATARRVVAARRRLTGDAARDLAGALYTLAHVLHARGALHEAAELLGEAVTTSTRLVGPRHPEVVEELEALAVVEVQRGREAAALETMARLRQVRWEPAWDLVGPAVAPHRDAHLLDALASLLRANHDCRHAQPLAVRALAAYAERPPGARPDDAHRARLRAAAAACPPPRVGAGRR